LQELIAPSDVQFYDHSWKPCGSKIDLCDEITSITGIDEEILKQTGKNVQDLLDTIPVCRKMSWVAKRHTNRPEDIAYCVLGIFNVNMPLLYGEGIHAFLRLQEAIIKKSNDLSILAWRTEAQTMPWDYHGILAPSPKEFLNSEDIELSQDLIYNPDFTVTNKGLRMTVALSVPMAMDNPILNLHCHRRDKPDEPLGIYLGRIGGGVYGRARPNVVPVETAGARSDETSIFLSQKPRVRKVENMALVHGHNFHFRSDATSSSLFELISSHPEKRWDKQFFRAKDAYTFVGINTYRVCWPGESIMFVVACGFGHNIQPWVCISKEGAEDEVWSAAHDRNSQRVAALGRQHQSSQIVLKSRAHRQKLWVNVQQRRTQGERGGYTPRWIDVALSARRRENRRTRRNTSRPRMDDVAPTMYLDYHRGRSDDVYILR
jgi:hypothetical protein